MPKINKYIEQVEELNKSFINQIIELGNESIKDMEEYKLLYSQAGAVVKINERFKQAQEKANELKDAHVAKLNSMLQTERGKINQGIQNYNELPTEQKILAQLERMNNFNSLTAEISSMEDEEILNLANEKYLSKDEASIIRKELISRAKSQDDTELGIQARTIKSTTAENLVEEAQRRVNTYNHEVWPGLSISQQLRGGVDKILGGDYVSKVNSDYYFEDGNIE